MNTDPKTQAAALADYFEQSEVKWKPQSVKGNRAMAIAYISARGVMDRLDEVLGPQNWQDEYELVPDGSVVCKLRVKFHGEDWVVKSDVGSPSEQPDDGDKLKAAFSDSLKRAAVKYGIGRFLYRLPTQWCDYDAQKRSFVHPPLLPSWARKGTAAGKPAEWDESKRRNAVPVMPADAPAGSDSGVLRDAKKQMRQQSLDTLNRLIDKLAPLTGKTAGTLAGQILGAFEMGEQSELSDLSGEQLTSAIRQAEAQVRKHTPKAQPA